jgi:DNA-directed RNA polymerase subunit RPC12/RpoP
VHSIESLPPGTDELLVHVIYACAACSSFHAHAAAFREVAALVNGSDTVPGLVHFGGLYLHCGKPLTLAGTAYRSIQAPLSMGDTPDAGLPDVVLTTKIMQCPCGFRIELPS